MSSTAKEELRQVTSLDLIQPARFAPGDHLIYAVVAVALDAHREGQEDKQFDYEVLSKVLHEYRELANDLHAVHQEGSSVKLEPMELTTERIQRHTSGLRRWASRGC